MQNMLEIVQQLLLKFYLDIKALLFSMQQHKYGQNREYGPLQIYHLLAFIIYWSKNCTLTLTLGYSFMKIVMIPT